MNQQSEQLSSILATGSATAGAFAVVLHTLPPYSSFAELHRHPEHIEACVVLEGVLAFTCEEETVMLRGGEMQLLLPGQSHTCWNPTATLTRLLLIYAPGVDNAELPSLIRGVPTLTAEPWDSS